MRRALSWAGAAFVVACLSGSFVLDADSALDYGTNAVDLVAYVPGLAATTLVGLMLSLRQPHQAVGWLLLLNGDLLALGAVSDSYAGWSLVRGDTDGAAEVTILWFTHGWPVIFAGIVAVAFVFPDGRLLPGRLWRWAAGFGVVAFVSTIIGGMLGHDTLDAPFSSVPPAAVLSPVVAGTLQTVGLLGMLATLITGVAALTIRFRRSSGVERLQLKWVALAGGLIPLAIVLGTVDGLTRDSGSGLLTAASSGLALAALPVAIGIAVLRYRLYDVDRVISGTVLYVVLTALLGAAFTVIVLAGGVTLGGGSPVPTAAATAAVLLAFRPLRSRLQGRVDRYLDRPRFVARRGVDEFLTELRAGRVEPESVGAAMVAAVGDPTLQLYFWFPDQQVHSDADGRAAELPSSGLRIPVVRGHEELATVVHTAGHPELARVLNDVIVRCGLAIEVARLRVEVRRRLAEVEDSRARLVAAAEQERHRLERDLHDGSQQRLVSIGLDLRILQRELPAGPLRDGLDQAVDGLAEAIRELRDLARGLRPDTLGDGLAPALAQLASRTAIRTEVDATGERFAVDIEAAAYFVASEALANAVKHSGAHRVAVAAEGRDGTLRLVVTDDGRGGAAAGRGLTGLADRVAAVGGRLHVASADGRGTTVEAVFPCG